MFPRPAATSSSMAIGITRSLVGGSRSRRFTSAHEVCRETGLRLPAEHRPVGGRPDRQPLRSAELQSLLFRRLLRTRLWRPALATSRGSLISNSVEGLTRSTPRWPPELPTTRMGSQIGRNTSTRWSTSTPALRRSSVSGRLSSSEEWPRRMSEAELAQPMNHLTGQKLVAVSQEHRAELVQRQVNLREVQQQRARTESAARIPSNVKPEDHRPQHLEIPRSPVSSSPRFIPTDRV